MNRIFQYGIYEAKIYFRIKVAVFYSIIFPVALLLLYYAANASAGTKEINDYFPYLVSITMISTSGGLAGLIVTNRIYNTWKFYSFFGYQTWQMTVAVGLIYFFLSEVICLVLAGVMLLITAAAGMSAIKLLLFMAGTGLGTLVYIEIAAITGLCIRDPKHSQTVINGLIYIFVVLSGSIFRFRSDGAVGKIMLLFPNIHIGNLLYLIWNYGTVDLMSLSVIIAYVIVFAVIIFFLVMKDAKRIAYREG